MFVEWMPVNIARAKLFRDFLSDTQGNWWVLVCTIVQWFLGSCGVA
jgi:hypothetical protein